MPNRLSSSALAGRDYRCGTWTRLYRQLIPRPEYSCRIFRILKLIAYLSSVFTLEPGDIISTGTPAGVGFARTPPRWLKAGDEVRVQVEGIGELVNPVVMEA
jgi:acylpyruvate hydrolase